MPKFIIEQDSSRRNIKNEPMPLGQFVPGAISLKNTNQVYTLFVGDINNGSLVEDLDVFKGNFKYYQQLLTLLPRLRNDVIVPRPEGALIKREPVTKPKINNITGLPEPYKYSNTDLTTIPHPNNSLSKATRKEVVNSMPAVSKQDIKMENVLKPTIANQLELKNKLVNLIEKSTNKTNSSVAAESSIKRPLNYSVNNKK